MQSDGARSYAFDKTTNTDHELAESEGHINLYIGDEVKQFNINYGYRSGEWWNVLAFDGETKEIKQCTPSLCPTPENP